MQITLSFHRSLDINALLYIWIVEYEHSTKLTSPYTPTNDFVKHLLQVNS